MHKRFGMLIIIILFLFASGCQTAQTPSPAPIDTAIPPTAVVAESTSVPASPTVAPIAEPVLELVGPGGSKQLTMDEIMKLPTTEGQAGIKSSTGKITLPELYKGVALKDLAALVGEMDASMGMNVVAKDGYGITYSYEQINNGNFISYDPATGDELKSPDPLTVILAYERNGESMPEDTDGKLRLAIVSEKNNQVTDGHWAVKWVTKVEVKTLSVPWSLYMEGALQETMDRATFESGAAPNCHGTTWKDDKAQDWVGIPLWYLLGRVDDEIKHEGPAFNDSLADAGYTVDVVASDGYTVTFDSAKLKRDNNIIIAYKVNDNPLPEKYFPLRLIGSDLAKNEMAGMISKIILHLKTTPAAATTENTPAATAGTATPEATTSSVENERLVISGLVETDLTVCQMDLKKMEVVKISADHPKKGQQEYEGVLLNTLLDQVKIKPEAKTLVFTADDGYSVPMDLATVRSCAQCLVAFSDEPGKLNLVMPGMESSAWIKSIVKIEAK